MVVKYRPAFIHQFNKLESALREEVLQRVEAFKNLANHKALRVHALHGRLKGRHSFAVNYRYRIVFIFQKEKSEAVLLAIGDHTVYDS